MTRRTAVFLLLGLLACAVYFLFWSPPAEAMPESSRVGENGERQDGDAATHTATREGSRRDTPGAEDRKPVSADAAVAAGRGSLSILVSWSDGSPAPDVAVRLRLDRPGLPRHIASEGITDSNGLTVLHDLEPGPVFVLARGRSVKSEVVAGDTVSVSVQLAKGIDVRGRVVDRSGDGVADAAVWLTSGRRDWHGGRVVARSAVDGAFRVRAVPEQQSLGAIAKGFAPSELVDLDEIDKSRIPISIQLVVDTPGGGVEGVVRDADGSPLSGAVVCVGNPPRRFESRRVGHSTIESWTPLWTRSDATGKYRFAGIAPGDHAVSAQLRRFAPWRGEVKVTAGLTSHCDITLMPEVTVSGTVTDGDGAVVAGAVIRAFDEPLDESFVQIGQFDYFGTFAYPFATTDGKGRYVLRGLNLGPIHLYATPKRRPGRGGSVARAKTVLEGLAGAALKWSPVLDRGLTITGTATFRDGSPMANHFVSVINQKSRKQQTNFADKEGRFEFANLRPENYTVLVQYWNAPANTPPLEKTDVFPGRGDVKLVATFAPEKKGKPCRVRGRISDPAGRIRKKLTVVLETENSWRTDNTVEDGEFRFESVRPGRYRIVAMSGQEVVYASSWLDLAAEEDRDLGTLTTEPGSSLRVRVDRGPGMDEIEPDVTALPDHSIHPRAIPIGLGNGVRVEKLNPGKYRVRARAAGMRTVSKVVDVILGREAEVTLELMRDPGVLLVISHPQDRKPGELHTIIHDTTGKKVWERKNGNLELLANPLEQSVDLKPGKFTVRCTTTNGGEAERSFEIAKVDEPVTVRLILR